MARPCAPAARAPAARGGAPWFLFPSLVGGRNRAAVSGRAAASAAAKIKLPAQTGLFARVVFRFFDITFDDAARNNH